MRKQLLCGVSAVAVIVAVDATAFAADAPVKKAPAPVTARLPDWSGFYIGGHLGYGEAKITGDWQGGTGQDLTKNLSGIVGGMHAGRNWQTNTFVYGWEADLSATGGWSTSVVKPDTVVDPTDVAGLHTKITALASLRARLGMLFTPNFHGYVTGGLAYAHGEAQGHTVSSGALDFAQQSRKFHVLGGVLGLGAEWKQTQNLSWRVEGLWYPLSKSRQFTIEETGSVKLDDIWVVRVGATYHFDGTAWGKAPVAAPAGLPVKGIGPAAPLLTWTGPYVGGHLGYGKAKITGDFDGGADQDLTKDLSGIVGGMHAGQNWQVNTFVYGWEADLSATGWSKNTLRLEPGGLDTLGGLHTKVTALASLRARLGMLFTPSLHGYVTGGLAYAHGKAQAHSVSTESGPLDLDGPQSQKFSRFSYVLGLGAEWKQTPNFSWRLEGLWYRLNDSKIFTPGNTGTVKLDDAWVVRLGATYHFDSSGWGKAPVVAARY
jgi:outer membrane immunogenic protein